MARKYSIPVPYRTTASDGVKIGLALSLPEVQAALKRIRPDVVAKLQRVGVFDHETFSQAELDSIPGDLWDRLAPHLG